MHATPARKVSNRTSWPPASPAPGSLRLFARVGAPFGGSYPASRLASLTSSRIPSRLGPLYGFAVVALRRAKVCTQPLSFTAGQSPLAAFPPAPGSHTKSTGFPAFPRCYAVPDRDSLSLTAPDPRWASLRFYRTRSSRRAQVCTLPLSVWSRTEPPGRLHPSTRNLFASSRIPRRLETFPTIVVPASRPFPSRFRDSR
jgi:hypothetical protein